MGGLSPFLLVGPFVAAVGVVAVFFVMRHKSVQTKSMYSSRRATIERKVKAARQRTLGPAKKEETTAAAPAPSGPAVPTFQASAFEGPPVAPPTYNPQAAAPPPATEAPPETGGPQPWEVGPTAPPPAPLPEILVVPPPPIQPEQVWSPSQAPAPERPLVETPAGAGASWSIVGEVKEETRGESGKKKKKRKEAPNTSGWQLASGEAPGTFYDDEEVKAPSAAMAIAQYAVLVVGLVMVLIGVLVMVANSQVT
jgi:hypothetical protein